MAPLLGKLPPFRAVACELMRRVRQDEVSMREIAELIRADAALSADVLRLANSPLFGLSRQVRSILHALALLGAERIRGLALTAALEAMFSEAGHAPAMRLCWRHNLACALLAENLAAAAVMEPDAAYTAGILHDIGRLALLAVRPSAYAALLETASGEERDPLAMERAAFGVDHCEAGAWLVRSWQFPAEFESIAGHHHDPAPEDRFDVPELVHVACLTADMVGFQVAGPRVEWDLERIHALLPATARRRFQPERTALREQLALKINSFEMRC